MQNVFYDQQVCKYQNQTASQKLEEGKKKILKNKCIYTFIWILNTNFLLLIQFSSFLKGVSTAREVYEVLGHRGWLELFPLFATVHEICIGRLPPSAIVEHSERKPRFELLDGSTQYC